MLPKVSREELLANVGKTDSGSSQELNDFKLRMMSAVGARGHTKRTISTKSAHLTTVPLDVSFMSSRDKQKYNSLQPYFPYSAKASSPVRQSRAQKQQHQSTLWKWRTESNGCKSEYFYSRVRAHSLRSAKTESEMKSMPYLVPRTASSRPNNKLPLSPDRSADLNRNRYEKVIKSKPLSAAPTPTVQSDMQTAQAEFGEMVMMGSGKAPGIVSTPVSLNSSKVQATRERVHVSRTKEEREKNPESIRLDKNGIRVFPDIGGGESVTLKLLSLQHNLITRLENVPLLSQLVVLDLYDNRVERISGLQGLPSIRVLLLGKNRIKRIEGLESLKRLEILDLHGNQLRYVDNLGPLTSLRVLNLAGNLLRNIRNLGPYGMSSLTELNLKRNRIKNLEGLQKAPHLKRLLIANNDLQTIPSLAPLRKLQYLRELVIDPNPMISSVAAGPEYRNQILTLFQNLSSLDRNPVTEEMRLEAKIWHRKKLAEEEARKQEEARLRDEIASKVGPPGSREQVIYQARRRWESLKNYVKQTTDKEPEDKVKLPKKKLKSVKSVVVAVASDKSRASDILYPPATLDLEHFPDGQVELEQIESLLGCNDVSNDDEEGSNAGKHDDADADNEEKPLSSSSEPEEEPDQSHNAPSHVITSAHDETNQITSENLTNPIQQAKKIFATINSNIELHIENANHFEASIKTSEKHKHDPPLLPPKITHPFKESTESPHCNNSTRKVFDALPSPASSDREKAAKVAVVRPLVREVIHNEEENSSIRGSASELTVISIPSNNGNFNESSICKETEGSLSKHPLSEITASESNFESVPSPASEVFNLKNATEEKCIVGDNTKTDNLIKIIPKAGEIEAILNSSTTPVQSQHSKENVRSKLLKHLRSISLDSYPHHQFFQQPEKEEKAEEENLQLSDENGEEEDDDNDNEVQDYDCDDAYSIATSTTTTGTSASTPGRNSTVMVTTNRLLKGGGGSFRKQTFPRTKSQRIKIRDRAAKLQQTSTETSRSTSTIGKRIHSGTGTRGTESAVSLKTGPGGRVLRRCDSAISLSTGSTTGPVVSTVMTGTNTTKALVVAGGVCTGSETENRDGATPLRKQGEDFLVEIEGKVLNVFGQGGLRHALTAFTPNLTCHVCTAKFHYISYDSIIPFFGKLRQVFPSLEHFHFRANNICTLAQLDALSDLQGLTSLSIAKEGNPIIPHEAWTHYASYRLSHWGLQVINGKEVCSEYRGGVTPAAQAKSFESLGFLALSCLPQTALTPLAKRLHMLHCFCCCSPSTSSDESSRPQRFLTVNSAHTNHARAHSPSQQTDHLSASNFCTAWDDDPVLLDVIGKEALVYCPLPSVEDDNIGYLSDIKREGAKETETKGHPGGGELSPAISSSERRRAETLGELIHSGVEIVEKIDRLEKVWPTLLTEVIQEMLMDFRFMDTYMKKELKKAQDITLINHHHHGSHNQQYQHARKNRH